MATEIKSAIDRHLSIVKSTWSKEVSDVKTSVRLITELKPVQGVLHLVGATVKNVTDGLKSHLETVRGRVA
jgi:hypothetical protein